MPLEYGDPSINGYVDQWASKSIDGIIPNMNIRYDYRKNNSLRFTPKIDGKLRLDLKSNYLRPSFYAVQDNEKGIYIQSNTFYAGQQYILSLSPSRRDEPKGSQNYFYIDSAEITPTFDDVAEDKRAPFFNARTEFTKDGRLHWFKNF